MIKRLRPLPSPDELAVMYATPHDHRLYGRGHGERVVSTIALARGVLGDGDRRTVVDLSCGNGEIARRIVAPGGDVHLGDLFGLPEMGAPGEYGYVGPIEETMGRLPIELVGAHDGVTWVLSETLEHLDDPTRTLERIRGYARHLVLSTPIDCWDDDNTEHLWAWDRTDVEMLLDGCGWDAGYFVDVDSRTYGETYRYGIWVCS